MRSVLIFANKDGEKSAKYEVKQRFYAEIHVLRHRIILY